MFAPVQYSHLPSFVSLVNAEMTRPFYTPTPANSAMMSIFQEQSQNILCACVGNKLSLHKEKTDQARGTKGSFMSNPIAICRVSALHCVSYKQSQRSSHYQSFYVFPFQWVFLAAGQRHTRSSHRPVFLGTSFYTVD